MKKGFTLIELIAVIAILGVIVMIVTPVVLNSINKSKEEALEEQKSIIEEAARNYMSQHDNLLPSDSCCININLLQSEGYLSSDDIINPTDNTKLTGYVKIRYVSAKNKYSYTYQKKSCTPCG